MSNEKGANAGDVLDLCIIGSGISGINTAYRAQAAFPNINYAVYESRTEIGGTWSLFKYPGIRSDSDLFSFGFEWRPWESSTVLAGADKILEYLKASMKSFGMDKKTHFKHKVTAMDWSTSEGLWTLTLSVNDGEKEKTVKARWVVLGTGYYDYEKALPAEIPGLENFKGRIVHPQFWPKDLDVTGKKVAIIGSGATAISIFPVIAKDVEKVTLVQRSPSYIVTIPNRDPTAEWLKRFLPLAWVVAFLRLQYILLGYLFVRSCHKDPQKNREAIRAGAKQQLPDGFDLDPHFDPKYGPWSQRMCFVPDGDFYEAIRSGKADMVTGHIETVTETGIKIKDQPESALDADIIVTATGLKVMTGGGTKASIDGKSVRLADKMLWRTSMVQDIPNVINVFGYANASWTLGADTAAKVLTRMMAYQKKHGYKSATATVTEGNAVKEAKLFEMDSTYLTKGRGEMFKAGDRYPWKARQGYFQDMWRATHGSLNEDMVFA